MVFNFVECWGDAHDFIELIEGSINTYKSIKIPIPHKDSRVDSVQMTIKTEKSQGEEMGHPSMPHGESSSETYTHHH